MAKVKRKVEKGDKEIAGDKVVAVGKSGKGQGKSKVVNVEGNVEKSGEVVWKCRDCPFEVPGNAADQMQMFNHIRAMKRQGEIHDYYLADADTGEAILDPEGSPIKSTSKAQSLGLIPIKGGKGKKGESKGGGGLRGRTQPIEVELDSRLVLLHDWDLIVCPDFTGSFSEWITDCIMGFHIQNRDTLRFGELFPEARLNG